MLTEIQQQKINHLHDFLSCHHYGKRSKKRCPFKELGITRDLFTSDFLFAKIGGHFTGTVIERLVLDGYVGKIPARSLPPRVVLARKVIDDDWDGIESSQSSSSILLLYSGTGNFRRLPKRYQTRHALLHQHRGGITPLLLAAHCGKLKTLPFHLLRLGDIDTSIVDLACENKEAECLVGLITTGVISPKALYTCLTTKYFPEIILGCSTARQMLAQTDRGSAVAVAAEHGSLTLLPTHLFIDHFAEVRGEIKAGLERLKTVRPPTGVNVHTERSTEAQAWSLKLAGEVLKR